MKRIFSFVLVAAIVAFCGAAYGSTISTTLEVHAEVLPACSEVSTTPVNFGNFSGSDIWSDGSVTVNCNEGTHFGIKMDGGQRFQVLTQQRAMSGPAGNSLLFPLGFFIGYQLYHDPARTDIWGDCVNSVVCFSPRGAEANGVGSPITFPIYGKAFGGPIPEIGKYSDVVNVVLEF